MFCSHVQIYRKFFLRKETDEIIFCAFVKEGMQIHVPSLFHDIKIRNLVQINVLILLTEQKRKSQSSAALKVSCSTLLVCDEI
jgi:hypothetical protein